MENDLSWFSVSLAGATPGPQKLENLVPVLKCRRFSLGVQLRSPLIEGWVKRADL